MPKFHRILYPLWISVVICIVLSSACAPLHMPSTTPQTKPESSASPVATATKAVPLTPTPTSAIQATEQELQGLQLTLWHPWRGAEKETLNTLISEFNQSNPWGINVNALSIPGIDQLDQQVQTVWGGEDTPNLVLAYAFQAQNWQKIKPLVLNWQDYLQDPKWGLSEMEQAQFFPSLWESSLVNGVRWGIPARRVGQILFYNASLAKELGFTTAPESSETFQKQACAAILIDSQTKLPTRSGWYLDQDYPAILSWLIAFGVQPVRADSQGYQWNTPAALQAFVFLRKLYDGGCTISSADVLPADALAQRQALFISANSGDIRTIQQAFQQASSRDQWTAIPFPPSAGEPKMLTYGVDYILIQSSAPEQLASWLFVKWMLSAEVQVKLAEKTSSLPLRSDAAESLKTSPHIPPVYSTLLNYLPYATPEPALASWNTVRWAVSDASKQLFAWYFTPDQAPTLAKLLQDTAQSFETQK
ncbi:MAG: extracellular solute-binding protein [Chloroflexota bacterium]